MVVTRQEIQSVSLEKLTYIIRHYPIEHSVGIKTFIGSDGSFAPEVIINIIEHPFSDDKKFIEVNCTIWVAQDDSVATLILDAWSIELGDNILHETANLKSLDEILPYLEKSIQLFGIEKRSE